MKKIRIAFLGILCSVVALPLLNFNMQPECVSQIDNRMLTEWDMSTGDATSMIDSYINDRIGFRTQAIDTYTQLNDRIYGMMIHPSYMYGKDGYVFSQMSFENPEPIFYDLFCAYLKQVQNYCEERNVPFIYCLNPSKVTIYEQYLPRGYHYENKVNQIMKQKLEEYEVNYITNEDVLKEKSKTEQVYNVKYDAGHWNALGAFYASNHLLEKVAQYYPEVTPRDKSDFEITEVLQTTLPVSHFEIEEYVPYFLDKNQDSIEDITEAYSGLKMNENYHMLACLVNHDEAAMGLPRVLMFQGSYYNDRYQFLQSAFAEYDAVHNYENFLEFDYYFNIFQPDCVILETAEYATNGAFFSYQGLEEKTLNPKLDVEKHKGEMQKLDESQYAKEENGNLLTITVECPEKTKRGYLLIGERQFDFKIVSEENIAVCTIDKKYYDENAVEVFWDK